MRLLFQQALRFAAVGVINSAIGLACIWAAMFAGVAALPANALGFAVGLSISYVLNRAWTFTRADAAADPLPWAATAPRFMGAFVVAWVLNATAVWLVIRYLSISPYAAQIAGVGVYSVTFFILCRVWVFAERDTDGAQGAVASGRDWVMRIALLAPLAAALAYLASKALDPTVAQIDLKYLWFAGQLWAEGTSPYGPQYLDRAREIFVGTNVPVWMAYPPNWYPLARSVALLPLDVAERLWGLLSGLMLLTSGGLVAWTVWRCRVREQLWPFVAFGVFLCMGSASAIAISVGQTAPLMAVGLALFLYGFVTRSQLALAAGLVIVMLKPNFGLPFVAFLLVFPAFWWAIIGAGLVSLSASAFALLPHGPVSVLSAYLEALGRYGTVDVNMPPSLTGLVNMLYNFAGLNLGGFVPVGITVVAALGVAVALRAATAGEQTSDRARLAAALALLGCVLFLTPFHTYDLLLCAPLLLLPAIAPSRWGIVTIGCLMSFLVIFRMNNLASVTGLTSPAETYGIGSAMVSFALLLLWCVSLVHLRTTLGPVRVTGTS